MKRLLYIKKKLQQLYDSIPNEKLKKNLLNALPFWIGSFITGLAAVVYAKLFSWAEHGTRFVFHHASWLFFIITPFCFWLAWHLVVKYAPFARGSGIPQVSAAIELANPKTKGRVRLLLNLKLLVIKVFSSLVMVFGGGAIGREGPTIQISAAIFKKINDLLPEWYPKISKRNMIITGAASGLASAFNTPLGGIVFAIEELTKTHLNFFKSALLTGVIISGLTALNLLGPYLYLGYPQLTNLPIIIVVPVVICAIMAGLSGSWMGEAILYILKRKNRLKKYYKHVLYVVVCGLIMAAMAIFINEHAFGSGKEIMVNTLFTADKEMPWYMPIVRVIGPIISFSTGAAGGVFAPSLSAGASIGALCAEWFHLTDSETNLIVLCGMVGFLTGITRSPFTSSILVIEMTNSHNIIFHLMLSALLANLFATIISRHSFYDVLKEKYVEEVLETVNKK
ncbi:MAG: chloride channel protein [Saprospiraceae bacterium]|nr:chloride channel protein [Lewinellaceae bacterium]